MSLSVVVKNVANTGEGPHWDERTKSLYYIDISAGNVHQWNSLTGKDTSVHLADLISFAIPRESGGIVASLGLTLATADLDTGAVHTIASVQPNTPECRFNDGKCDRSGRLWAGTMGKEKAPAIMEVPQAGCLYSVECDETFRKRDEKIDLSNGLAWTADDRTMFFIDSTPYYIYAYDFDIATGNATNRRIAIDMKVDPSWGIPDGCCIDTNDHLWVACYGTGRVMQFDMVTGKPIRTVEIPTALNTTSCCFGGEHMDELYVTTMIRGVSFDVQPDAGSVFKVSGLGAKGFPAPRFQG